jgi:hypothetical protein
VPARRERSSKLLSERWTIDGLGTVSLLVPSESRLKAVDTAWPDLRQPTDFHLHWRWAEIAGRNAERFALVDSGDQVVSLWSTAKRMVRLEGRQLYRLDYLEVDPGLRGGFAGSFTLALVGARALELGCEGLVLAAFPVLTGFYDRSGGVQRNVVGWKTAAGLLPFYFDAYALARFREVTDAARKEEQQE